MNSHHEILGYAILKVNLSRVMVSLCKNSNTSPENTCDTYFYIPIIKPQIKIKIVCSLLIDFF